MNLRRVFLDANVLVAIGLRPRGSYRRFLDVEDHRYVTSEHILAEVEENLTAMNIHCSEFLTNLRKIMEVTDRVSKLPVGLPLYDDEDRQALAEAIGAECDEFVTFNSNDFNAIYNQRIEGVLIRHSADFKRQFFP